MATELGSSFRRKLRVTAPGIWEKYNSHSCCKPGRSGNA